MSTDVDAHLQESVATVAPAGATQVAISARDKTVLGLISSGYTNKEIAYRLGISPATINKLVTRLLREFGVANRAALVRAAVEARVLAFDVF